jgi:hypothetical protein
LARWEILAFNQVIHHITNRFCLRTVWSIHFQHYPVHKSLSALCSPALLFQDFLSTLLQYYFES